MVSRVLLCSCLKISRVFWVVSRVLLCSCWDVLRSSPLLGSFCVLGGLQGVAM